MIFSDQLKAGDLGRIVLLHGELYSKEYGYDVTFEAYVAEPLAQFAKRNNPRERIWLAKHEGELIGCICICERSETVAQLRWYLLHPQWRGKGIGKILMQNALNFCTEHNYTKVILWTVAGLKASHNMYIRNGFKLSEEHERVLWGLPQIEQCYEKDLNS